MLSKTALMRVIGIACMCIINPIWAADEPATREEKILDDYNNDYNCGQVVPMGVVNPADYSADDLLQGLHLGKETLPLILGNSTDLGGGTVVYQKLGAQWQARIIRMGTSITQVYTNAERSVYWIFFMHTAEAPGQIEYLHLTQNSARCGELDSPADINQPHWKMEYADLAAFNIDTKGDGIVQARADIYEDNEKSHTNWYQYKTDNNGEDWSKPLAADKPLKAPTGVWQKAQISKPDFGLLKSLSGL